jgi:hypothetical protein
MSAGRTDQSAGRSRDILLQWRREQLVGAGFAPALAARVARDGHYDLHALIELHERGCPPDLAVRILAPLDSEDTA